MDKNKIGEHLLYIDITNQCSLDCEFCMYKKERENGTNHLILDINAKRNLHDLINTPSVSHIIISGEGEPFNNTKGIFDILNLSEGKKDFQIITNGFWFSTNGAKILKQLNTIANNKNDRYSIRLSIDSFHIKKADIRTYINFFILFNEFKEECSNINFSIRSLIEEKRVYDKTHDFNKK